MTAQQQGTHHFILTLQSPAPGGAVAMSTFSNAITPPAGWNRSQLYKALLNQVTSDNPELAGANTVFFSLERNEI